ncbi:MAG: glycosyltransferase [Bacteroidales bacterium]|nr:glycosyltransferase [Bacteroidales bacterium]
MKLLVVLSRFPYPLEKGDKLRAYHQIRVLSRQHDIYLFALSDNEVPLASMEAMKPFCQEIRVGRFCWWTKLTNSLRAFFKGWPIQCGYFYSREAKKALRQFADEVKPDMVYAQLVRTVPYVQELEGEKTIDYQDVFSQGMLRRAQRAPFWKRPFFKMESRRLRRYEAEVFPLFQHHTIITEVDRDLMPVKEKDKIRIVGNGVDFEQYRYEGQEKNYDLIFAGNMSYAPNVDAAEFIVKQILPRLLPQFPNLRLVLCGTDPAPRVRALQGPHVTVTGWVESIAEYYAQSRIFLAPMRLGTGLQNKLLEAMATQLPCVTSPLAGKPLKGITDQHDILICDKVEEYVEAITQLLTDNVYYQQISQQGYQYVQQRYSWEAATEPLLQLTIDS